MTAKDLPLAFANAASSGAFEPALWNPPLDFHEVEGSFPLEPSSGSSSASLSLETMAWVNEDSAGKPLAAISSTAMAAVSLVGLRRTSRDVDGLEVSRFLRRGVVVRNRYRIEQLLSIDGLTTAYLARDLDIGASRAIRVLHGSLAAHPEAAECFLHQARAVSRVQNPHVEAVSDYGCLDNGLPYMATEYVRDEDLDSLLDGEGPLPWWRVRLIALQLCEALGAAHRNGVVHRDVNLRNCYRQDGGRLGDFIKMVGFGMAGVVEAAHPRTNRWWSGSRFWSRDHRLPIVASLDYMAPELARCEHVDHRADIYSLGVTLFALLTGRLPFESDDAETLIRQHLVAPAPRPSDFAPHLSPRIDHVILRALAKNATDRYRSMAEFAEAIERLDEPHPSSSFGTFGLAAANPFPDLVEPRSSRKAQSDRLWWVVPSGIFAGTATFLLLASLVPFPLATPQAASAEGMDPQRDPETASMGVWKTLASPRPHQADDVAVRALAADLLVDDAPRPTNVTSPSVASPPRERDRESKPLDAVACPEGSLRRARGVTCHDGEAESPDAAPSGKGRHAARATLATRNLASQTTAPPGVDRDAKAEEHLVTGVPTQERELPSLFSEGIPPDDTRNEGIPEARNDTPDDRRDRTFSGALRNPYADWTEFDRVGVATTDES